MSRFRAPRDAARRLAELLKFHLDRASLATGEYDAETVGRLTPHMTDVATLEAALDHPAAIGAHRAAILKRLEQLRHPLSEQDKLAMFVRDNPGFANWLGIHAEGSPCRYRTAWEYFR